MLSLSLSTFKSYEKLQMTKRIAANVAQTAIRRFRGIYIKSMGSRIVSLLVQRFVKVGSPVDAGQSSLRTFALVSCKIKKKSIYICSLSKGHS